MAAKLTVTYEDGNTETIALRPKGIIATERKFGADFPDYEGSLYAAWFLKGMPSGDFDAWLDGVADADIARDEAPPLVQEASPEG